jgi:DNA-binding CsgD family transcriptional regulator
MIRLAQPITYDGPVSADLATVLKEGDEALKVGDWPTAKRSYLAALELEETPEALLGLGNALWWLQDIEASLRYRERAYAVLRRRSEPMRAAIVALQLCPHYSGNLGNFAAARGWLARAARLAEEFKLAELDGWLFLGRAALATTGGNPQTGEGLARDALEFARRFPDADLELCALSQLGGALIMLGRIEEGAALLDEAMAGALGGEGGLETVVHASCATIVSCSRAAEVKRAVQWIRAANEFNRRYGSPHLDAVCRTAYSQILLATGRWAEAEAELQGALDKMSTRAEPLIRTEALATFAELRLAQGRIEEAARLLEGIEDHVACAKARASLALARGQPGVAASVLRRRLRGIGETLESASQVELLIEVEVELRATQAALTRARRLAALGASVNCEIIRARGERALGRSLLAMGDPSDALAHLERAFETFSHLELPFEAARARFLLARALGEASRESAIAEAQLALATFESLGAARDADGAAAFLRSLGVKAARGGPRSSGRLTRRELEVLVLLGEGLSNSELAERLCLTRKTVENHVASIFAKLELSSRAEAAVYAVRHSHTYR